MKQLVSQAAGAGSERTSTLLMRSRPSELRSCGARRYRLLPSTVVALVPSAGAGSVTSKSKSFTSAAAKNVVGDAGGSVHTSVARSQRSPART